MSFTRTRLQLLVVILLVFGVFFRFVNLDQKLYWFDEVYTSLRIAGYTATEVVQEVFNGQEIGPQDLKKYQSVSIKRGLPDTVRSLVLEDPHQTPLYYLIARWWAQWFGDSVTSLRSLSALISLLAFPCIYWLCIELFNSSTVGKVAVALIAVSPFHVLYAQEARPYALWTVAILLSSAALLRALRIQTNLAWGAYAATVILGVYSHLFFLLVMVSYIIYIFVTKEARFGKNIVNYLFASLLGLVAFAPWLFVINSGVQQIQSFTEWITFQVSLSSLLNSWVRNIGLFFLDVQPVNSGKLQPVYLLIVLLVVYALYFLYKKAQKQAWFVVTLIIVTALALVIPDLLLGGVRSTVTRYLIPCCLGIQIAIAYLIADQIAHSPLTNGSQRVGKVLMMMLAVTGIVSCALISQRDIWWNKLYVDYRSPQTAAIVNNNTRPLLISESHSSETLTIGNLLSLSHLLDSDVRLQLVVKPNLPRIPSSFDEVFLLDPSDSLRRRLEEEKTYKARAIFMPGKLWKLEKLKAGTEHSSK